MTELNFPTEDVKNNAIISVCGAVELDRYWPHIEQMLNEVPHTWEDYTLEYIYDKIMSGNMQVWAVGTPDRVEMVLFTQVAYFPRKKSVQLVWIAGTGIDKYIDVIDTAITEFAYKVEADGIDILDGRGGWERKLKSIGFRPTQVILSRPLDKKKRIH